jgi:carbonic anhydrase
MKKLIQGIAEFRRNLTEENRHLYATLALGQKADTLFIACCDSRVVPNLFASTNPGDLFVLRNMGNLIPPATCPMHDNSASATLEFSMHALDVRDIIVCGHSECGAMQSILKGIDTLSCPHLESWLKYGQEALDKVRQGFVLDPNITEVNQISQMNVLQQMEHIRSYPFIQERLKKKEVRIHGWWFDIAHADVYCYEQDVNRFVLIDDQEVDVILERTK